MKNKQGREKLKKMKKKGNPQAKQGNLADPRPFSGSGREELAKEEQRWIGYWEKGKKGGGKRVNNPLKNPQKSDENKEKTRKFQGCRFWCPRRQLSQRRKGQGGGKRIRAGVKVVKKIHQLVLSKPCIGRGGPKGKAQDGGIGRLGGGKTRKQTAEGASFRRVRCEQTTFDGGGGTGRVTNSTVGEHTLEIRSRACRLVLECETTKHAKKVVGGRTAREGRGGLERRLGVVGHECTGERIPQG